MKIKIVIFVIFIFFICYSMYGFIENSSFYGYSQIDYSVTTRNQDSPLFEINRVNFVGDFQLSPQARFITDIELEHNTHLGEKGNIGNLKFSQVWAEYSLVPAIKIRAGKLLTNFGLYNKIHDASPTYFSISPPLLYSRFSPNSDFKPQQRYYGKYILGTEVTGTLDIDNDGAQFEYSLLFGNGRHDNVNGTYIDNNTAFAGRAVLRSSKIPGLQYGFSYYTDVNEIGIGGVPNSRESLYGLELEYDWQNILVQGEFYFADFKNLSLEDQYSVLSYLQFAYTIEDIITPYFQLNWIKFDSKKNNMIGSAIFGLNYPLTTNFYIKVESQYNYSNIDAVLNDYGTLKGSISVAF